MGHLQRRKNNLNNLTVLNKLRCMFFFKYIETVIIYLILTLSLKKSVFIKNVTNNYK